MRDSGGVGAATLLVLCGARWSTLVLLGVVFEPSSRRCVERSSWSDSLRVTLLEAPVRVLVRLLSRLVFGADGHRKDPRLFGVLVRVLLAVVSRGRACSMVL